MTAVGIIVTIVAEITLMIATELIPMTVAEHIPTIAVEPIVIKIGI